MSRQAAPTAPAALRAGRDPSLASFLPHAPQLSRVVRLGRWLTAGWRLMPDFLIIGAQRCGTTSLFRHLVMHPCVAPPLTKEIHFFDYNFDSGLRWYRAHFPLLGRRILARRRGQPLVTGEASPYYLLHPLAPERVRRLLPDVKLIVLLRNPVDRAYSQYHHNLAKGVEPLSFEAAIDAERSRVEGESERTAAGDGRYVSVSHRKHSYLLRGIYVDQFRAWMTHFPPHHWLVLRSEDFYADPGAVLRQVLAHLGLPDWQPPEFPRHGRQDYAVLEAATRRRLLEFFEPHNQRLYEHLGRDFEWTA